jgi:diaminopropionate ammonia-lyase
VTVFINPAVDPGRVTRDPGTATAFHRSLPGYTPTPLHKLGPVYLKDESNRLGLPAFKVLGTTWAVHRALTERPETHTFIAASAGNHGRAVAHVARQRGLRAEIYLPARATPARRRAIESEGANVVMIDGDYEDAVAAAARAADKPGHIQLADVGASGPALWVIEGYATLFAELPDQTDMILVPAGVGSLAAAAARFGAAHGARIIAIEPETAACVTASLQTGQPVTVPTPGTTMAGLDCAAVSPAAWRDLKHGIHATVTVTDTEVHAAMRQLAASGHSIGDCGAAPLAAIPHIDQDLLGSDTILIATEGITDRDTYRRTVTAHRVQD